MTRGPPPAPSGDSTTRTEAERAAGDEEELARFTRWFEQRPNSLEFWELVVTDRRVLWCFVGETYRSLLLRADMGERDREALDDLSPAEAAEHDPENFAVPLADLLEIRLVTGTLFRRERLVVRWRVGDEVEEVVLYRTGGSEPQADLVEELSADPRLGDVDVTVEAPGSVIPVR